MGMAVSTVVRDATGLHREPSEGGALSIIEQEHDRPVEQTDVAVRLVRRLWICGTVGCGTRVFWPGPLCPGCRECGKPVKARPIGW
jgi:hypothetical protein